MLRPSICPHHAMVFASRGRSYRELPLRVAELGGMFRAERSGVLGRAVPGTGHLAQRRAQLLRPRAGRRGGRRRAGMMAGRTRPRLRAAGYRLSLRGPAAGYLGARLGSRRGAAAQGARRRRGRLRGGARRGGVLRPEDRRADRRRRRARAEPGHRPGRLPPAGTVRSVLCGRRWSAARPVMVHRSIVGSFERLFAHLIEVHKGAFPAWYAPVQVIVAPIGEQQADAAARFARRCAGPACAPRRSSTGRSAPGSATPPCGGAVHRRHGRTGGSGGRGLATPARWPRAGRAVIG